MRQINPAAKAIVNGQACMIRIKRVYDEPAKTDGYRILVDGLWPRGVTRGSVRMEAWLKEAAPSAELRRWFKHDPARWPEFRRRYWRELEARPDSWAPILARVQRGKVTLLYGARDVEHNNAVVLRDFLNARLMKASREGS